MPLSKVKTYTIKANNIVSDKGAKTKLLITHKNQTSLGGVGDLTTASKQLIVQIIDNHFKVFLAEDELIFHFEI